MAQKYPVDIEIGEDRDITINDNSLDANLTDGYEVVQQTAAIAVGNLVHNLVGSKLTGVQIENVRSEIARALNTEPLFNTISTVQVIEIDKRTNTIVLKAVTTVNQDFLIEV